MPQMWIGVTIVELALLTLLGVMFRRAAKRYTRIGLVWFLAGVSGFAVTGISGAMSTVPTSAPRITVRGRVQSCAVHELGGKGNRAYSFLLSPENGSPIEIATRINPPLCWSRVSAIPGENVYRVTYLDDLSRTLKHEAIRVDVLSGERTGWSGWVDASPFGLWLGVPAGLVLIVVGIIRAENNHRESVEPPSEAAPNSLFVKDDDSDLTDLNLH
jgi:hypothetical protein